MKSQNVITPVRTRYFAHGELRYVVLMLLADAPGHGYELIKRIEALTQGHYIPSPGVLYPTLEKLKNQGLLHEQPGGEGQKPLGLSLAGQQWLTENQAVVADINARIKSHNVGYGLRQDPQMQRALANLKNTLDIRVNQQQASAEQIRQIVKLLDETALAIAQLS